MPPTCIATGPDPGLRLPVHPAHRASHPRARRLLRDPSCGISLDAVRRFAPQGIVLSGGRRACSTRTRRSRTAKCSSSGFRCWHLLRPPVDVPAARRCRRGIGRSRVRRAQLKLERRGDPLFAGLEDRPARTVWMSHGDRVLRLPRASSASRRATTPRLPPCATASDRSTASSSTPRWRTRRRRRAARELRARHLRLRRLVVDGGVHRRGGGQDPHAGRCCTGRVRALGRRRLVGGGRAGAPCDRREAALHPRRPRTAARERGQRSRAHLPRGLGIPLTVVDASERFLAALAGVSDPERSAASSAISSSRSSSARRNASATRPSWCRERSTPT